MAAIDFPAAPTVGQTFFAGNGVTYMWNGTLWLATGMAAPGGDFYATATLIAITGSFATMILPTVLTGNSGGWYNTSNGRYTPPAGRYVLMGGVSTSATTASTISVKLRKNGTDIGAPFLNTITANNFWSDPQATRIVDANGSDWFDMQVSAGSGASGNDVWLSAFPISGIKGPPGDLANVPGADAGCKTTPLGANVALNNTTLYFNGPNTGLIGASGQKWRISAKAGFSDASSPVQFELRLFDGTAAVPNTASLHTQGTGGAMTAITTECIVTLTGPTTFTAQGRDFNFASGTMFAANTSITAERLT